MKPPSGSKKTNPIQTQSKPVLSAVEWANFKKEEYMVICSELLATETQYPAVFHRKVQPTVRCGHAVENRQRFEFVFG